MLLTLGKPEVLDILEQEGEVSVTCEFCNGHYRFDSIDIEQIFSESVAAQPSVSEH